MSSELGTISQITEMDSASEVTTKIDNAINAIPATPGTEHIGPNGIVASAGGVFTFVGDELVWQIGANTHNDAYWTFVVPLDYVSGGEIEVWSRRTGSIVADISAWINNVADSTITAATIDPVANATWEKFVLVFGDSLAAGDIINIEQHVITSAGGGNIHQNKAINFNYNN